MCTNTFQTPPLEFQVNDFLGLYQPPFSDTEVEVYYQTTDGPQNFVRFYQDSPLPTQSTSEGGGYNDLPLVAVEVNGKLNLYHPRKLLLYVFVCGFRRKC